MTHSYSRRRFLTVTGLATTAGLAGCNMETEPATETDETPRHTAVRDSAVYLGPHITADLPAYVTVVDSATAADVAILANDTPITGETVVGWLVEGIPTGVYGEPAISRLLALLRDGDVTDHFDGDYLSAGRGAHDIAVFYPAGKEMSSYTGRIEGREPSLVNVLDRVLAWISSNDPPQ